MSRGRDKYRKYLSGNEKRVKRAKIELENNIMRGSLKIFINNSSSNNVILTSTNEKPANNDHTEVQNEHNDTLCKTDDTNIKIQDFSDDLHSSESFSGDNHAKVSMKKCINSSSSSNVTFTSTNEKSDDHEEVQNAHYDTLCKIDDININFIMDGTYCPIRKNRLTQHQCNLCSKPIFKEHTASTNLICPICNNPKDSDD
ncbi:hypothetical protein QTP88_005973 [Uroleucon formosanum]